MTRHLNTYALIAALIVTALTFAACGDDSASDPRGEYGFTGAACQGETENVPIGAIRSGADGNSIRVAWLGSNTQEICGVRLEGSNAEQIVVSVAIAPGAAEKDQINQCVVVELAEPLEPGVGFQRSTAQELDLNFQNRVDMLVSDPTMCTTTFVENPDANA